MSTYYLKPDGDNGLDGSSWANAWKTIGHAQTQLQAGDTLITDGTFTDGPWQVTMQGTEANPITIQSDTQWSTHVKGPWPHGKASNFPQKSHFPPGVKYDCPSDQKCSGYKGDKGLLELKDCEWVIVDGLEASEHWARGLFFNNSSDCTFVDCYIHHVYETGMKSHNSTNCTFDTCRNWHCAQRGYFRDEGWIDNHPTVSSATDSDGATFHNCDVRYGGGEGIGAGQCGINTTINGCFVADCRTVHIYTDWAKGAVITNNIMFNSSFKRAGSKNPTSGFTARDENGADGDCLARRSTDVVFENNLLIGFGEAILIGTKANMVRYKFLNNTVINCNVGLLVRNHNDSKSPSYRHRYECVFANNLIWANSNTVSENARVPSKQGDPNFMKFSNNLWKDGTRPNKAKGSNDVLASNVAAVIVDANAPVTAETVDVTNYYLAGGSPAINAGGDYGVNTDNNGYPRTGTPDIGAFEKDSVANPDLVADFDLSATEVQPNTAVTLTDQSTISAGAIDSWLWEYSLDNVNYTTIGTSQNESFTPTQTGQYKIRLTIEDTDTSDSDTASAFLSVTTGEDEEPEDPENPVPDSDHYANMLSNGDFATGDKTNWSTSNCSTSVNANDELELDNVTSAAGAQFYQTGLSITSGDKLVISFKAKITGGSGRTIGVEIIDHSSGDDIITPQAMAVAESDEWQYFNEVVDAIDTTANGRFRIRPYALNASSTLVMDDFVVRPHSPPTAGFTPSATTFQRGTTLTATDTSTGTPTSWSWEIKQTGADDSEYEVISTDQDLSWQSDRQGAWTLRLTVANGDGADSTTTDLTIKGSGDWFRRSVRRSLRRGMP